MENYNSQSFTPEEVKKGLHLKFIKSLLEISSKKENSYFDIHITTDSYCTIVEWSDVSFEDGGGKFEFVDANQVIMTEKLFPDNHYEYFTSEEEYKERLEEWLKENPEWELTPYGTWTNRIENEAWKKELEEQGVHYENGIPQGE